MIPVLFNTYNRFYCVLQALYSRIRLLRCRDYPTKWIERWLRRTLIFIFVRRIHFFFFLEKLFRNNVFITSSLFCIAAIRGPYIFWICFVQFILFVHNNYQNIKHIIKRLLFYYIRYPMVYCDNILRICTYVMCTLYITHHIIYVFMRIIRWTVCAITRKTTVLPMI